MNASSLRRAVFAHGPFAARAALFFGLALMAAGSSPAPAAQPLVRLANSVPASQPLRTARLLGRVAPGTPIHLAISLPLRNQAQLTDLLRRLYDPADPLHGRFLSTAEFTNRFGPTQEDYDVVAAWAQSQGLTVTHTYPSRTLIDVTASAATMEGVFAVRLNRFRLADGREVYAHAAAPRVPASIAHRIEGIIGLSNIGLWQRSYLVRAASSHSRPPFALSAPNALTGPAGGLAPQGIKTAYSLSTGTLDGTGQTLGLYQLDGYVASDITQYANQFGLPAPNLENVLVDGFDGSVHDTNAQGEVTLDISMMMALSPGAKILVYEGANGTAAALDIYTQLANDNRAKSISSSWGLAEDKKSSATIQSESTAFQQMAAQGQSMFDAAGDSGAYDDSQQLSVEDPAGQPYVTGVGGTTLYTNLDGSYYSETTWANPNSTGRSPFGSGGGGGISQVWPIPDYQKGITSNAPQGEFSTTMRNVPDVSLDSDPQSGYDIYQADNGGWVTTGGTSAAAPLWAAFVGLVNQQRQAQGQGVLGFANPGIYQVAQSANGANLFHDINDNSTNLYYHAVNGYDDATGWGTFIGDSLITALAGVAGPPTGSAWNATAIANGPDNRTRILWAKRDGTLALWSEDDSSGSFTQNVYGPYGGWTAKALSVGPDNRTRVLWSNADGTLSLWSKDPASGNFTQFVYGPFAGWTATAIATGPDNRTSVLWSKTDGTLALWSTDPTNGGFTQHVYGPFGGWTATALSVGPDNRTRVLWSKTDGTLALWSVDPASGGFTQFVYGPFAGWTATSLATGPDNRTNVLWRNTNGTLALWSTDPTNGGFTQHVYGPFTGWSPTCLSDGPDTLTRVLWSNTNGQQALWSVNNSTSGFTQHVFGPF